MPSPLLPIHDDNYAQLIAALHPPPPVVSEIEILPSSFPPKILLESGAVGVPKSLLVPLYLEARKTFFDHISSQDSESYHAALQATSIVLLFDPNHLTAANFRKRHIERFFGTKNNENGYIERDNEDLIDAVRNELRFLESLITSPLGKHAKSSTLWAQRLWIVENFPKSAIREHASDEAIEQLGNARNLVRGFWDRELAIVMKAGERHARNYYAWQYGRQLFSFVSSLCSEPEEERRDLVREMLREGIGLVRGWCLMHPRDISGWTFLAFLLEEQLRDEEGCQGGGGEGEDAIGTSTRQIRDFTQKYDWKGESIDWFLKAMEILNEHR